MKRSDLLSKLKNGQLNDRLEAVYGKNGLSAALQRLTFLVEEFGRTFPCSDDTQTLLFSAPGRTELGGNHTDHQRGHCLAASVDLDTIACVVPNGSNIVRPTVVIVLVLLTLKVLSELLFPEFWG